MSRLESPALVTANLREAVVHLGAAHAAASEREGMRDGLNGRVRDMIFALNSGVDSLADMIEEGRFSIDPEEPASPPGELWSNLPGWPGGPR